MYGLYNTEQTFFIDGAPYDVGYDRDYTLFLPQVFRPVSLAAPDFTPGPSGTVDPRVEPVLDNLVTERPQRVAVAGVHVRRAETRAGVDE